MKPSELPPNRRVERSSEPPPEAPDLGSVPPVVKGRALYKGRSLWRRIVENRWTRRLQLMVGVVVVIAASLLVAWGLRRYLRSSPRFAVRTLHVDGNHRRTPHQIAKRAGILIGDNIFGVDETLAQAAIESDPWVSKAKVRTELPGTVVITVEEREPHALAIADGRLYLVDSTGDVFKEYVPGDPDDLPVVTGIDPQAVVENRDAERARVRRALELIRDLERAKLAERYPVQEVNIASDGALTVMVTTAAIAVAFGQPPYRAKIEKAERILAEMRHRNVKPAAVFLDNEAHPERVVVRMR
jgi:cell division protein FtsQ